jgi:EmrB/QacA subfamily drug resistance transporter
MGERDNRWWVLIGSCSGLFVLMLDSTVVVLALPAIHDDLNASTDGLQWVQNAYLLTIAATVVTAGRLGDIRGRQRIFLIGMAAFAAGSVLAGAADSEQVLVAARVVQGIGGAALLSLSLALTSHAFPRDQQARALGIWAAVSAIALAIGPLVGGALIEAASWRWIFFINVPVCAAGIAILLLRGTESRDPDAPRQIDVAGAAVLAVGLTAIVLALVQADEWGWGSARILALIAGGVLLLFGFWKLEHRRPNPLLDFSLFRNGPYLGATAAAFALVGSYWTVMFFEPQFLQQQLGYSAVEAGAMVLPITVPMAVFSPFSGRLIARLGVRATMTTGMAVALAGVALTALAQDSGSYSELLPGFLLFGISLALVYAPMSTAAMAAMPTAKCGIASGVLAMNRVLAGAMLLAAAGAVFQGELPSGYTGAVAAALVPAVIVLVPGMILTWLLVRAPADPVTAPEGELQHHQHHRRFHF